MARKQNTRRLIRSWVRRGSDDVDHSKVKTPTHMSYLAVELDWHTHEVGVLLHHLFHSRLPACQPLTRNMMSMTMVEIRRVQKPLLADTTTRLLPREPTHKQNTAAVMLDVAHAPGCRERLRHGNTMAD